MKNLDKNYNPSEFEERIYEEWEREGLFKPSSDQSKEPFTISMPPPNVTGVLHMGHALTNTMQDTVIRYKRLKGYRALWLPGTDHASIATEARVVEKLKKEGKSKESLGREGFLKEAWDWTHKYGGDIINQLKKLGASADWSRQRFTLDEVCSRAVMEVFNDYYEKGLIYRGDRIINWCPHCMTAISDQEVDHEEHKGSLWRVRYKLKDEEGYIEIETTRPETILGDLAVAVNPEDPRYKNYVGKTCIVPLLDREVPIISDEYVDMEFGTGAVKITPSHDPNDFEVGERHNLGTLTVMNEDGSIKEGYGDYSGLDRFEARKKIVSDLKNLGDLVSIRDYDNNVGHCSRCDTVVEPLLSKQWFVKMEGLRKKALLEYKKGNLHFIPERMGKIYQNWLENLKDWCISRQLWWGHRIPVWYCDDCKEIIVSREEVKECPNCKGTLRQDEDTLDTWFSSALWPFSTLGWPEETEDFKTFFPNQLLITGYDIIFFWVIRMVFSSLEQTGKLPFTHVLFNGLVRDELGRKMSKSLDNGIDPLDIIKEYGADALRFTLVRGTSPGGDMRFYYERVEASRNFANKLWNATRFLLMHIEEEPKPFDINDLKPEDKWILSSVNSLSREVSEKFDRYELGLAGDMILDFTWGDFCDWYIEMVKSRLFGRDEKDKEVAKAVLLEVLSSILIMLHPFMPFITEEIWGHLPNRKTKLIVANYPEYRLDRNFSKEEREINLIKNLIKAIRNIRTEMKIAPSRKAKEIFVSENSEIREIILNNEVYFKTLSYAEEIEVRDNKEGLSENYVAIIENNIEIFMPTSDLIDIAEEIKRLNKELEKFNKELNMAKGKLNNEGFVNKAPKDLIEKENEKIKKYTDMIEKTESRIKELENVG